jgi:hypothetical protein
MLDSITVQPDPILRLESITLGSPPDFQEEAEEEDEGMDSEGSSFSEKMDYSTPNPQETELQEDRLDDDDDGEGGTMILDDPELA